MSAGSARHDVRMEHLGGRHFLRIPGPTNVPDRVLRAMAAPTIDHRGPEFAELARQVLAGVGQLCGSALPVAIYPSSGTGAWEATLVKAYNPRSGAPFIIAAPLQPDQREFSGLGIAMTTRKDARQGIWRE